jgi:lipoprotein-anchoring transpeptidase ErfK/SrfK
MKQLFSLTPITSQTVATRERVTRNAGPAVLLAVIFGSAVLSACSGARVATSEKVEYLASGSIVISRMIPTDAESQVASATADAAANDSQSTPRVLAPLFAFIPPAAAFAPAENETWVEVDTGAKKVRVYKGATIDSEFQAEGAANIQPGNYSLQQKQRTPLWYAPDGYFRKRQLAVPPAGDRLRYLKGALGEYALFPSPEFAIHTAPVWTDDVGGLRVSKEDLIAIYFKLNIGSSIVVR